MPIRKAPVRKAPVRKAPAKKAPAKKAPAKKVVAVSPDDMKQFYYGIYQRGFFEPRLVSPGGSQHRCSAVSEFCSADPSRFGRPNTTLRKLFKNAAHAWRNMSGNALMEALSNIGVPEEDLYWCSDYDRNAQVVAGEEEEEEEEEEAGYTVVRSLSHSPVPKRGGNAKQQDGELFVDVGALAKQLQENGDKLRRVNMMCLPQDGKEASPFDVYLFALEIRTVRGCAHQFSGVVVEIPMCHPADLKNFQVQVVQEGGNQLLLKAPYSPMNCTNYEDVEDVVVKTKQDGSMGPARLAGRVQHFAHWKDKSKHMLVTFPDHYHFTLEPFSKPNTEGLVQARPLLASANGHAVVVKGKQDVHWTNASNRWSVPFVRDPGLCADTSVFRKQIVTKKDDYQDYLVAQMDRMGFEDNAVAEPARKPAAKTTKKPAAVRKPVPKKPNESWILESCETTPRWAAYPV